MNIIVTPEISIDADEITEDFVRSSGPGGQNVNKVSTSVRLHFDVQHSLSLPAGVRSRLTVLAGKRMNREGILTIRASRFRTQEQNRTDAILRFVELVRAAAEKPKARRRTRPTKGSVEKRLKSKTQHGRAKKNRSKAIDHME